MGLFLLSPFPSGSVSRKPKEPFTWQWQNPKEQNDSQIQNLLWLSREGKEWKLCRVITLVPSQTSEWWTKQDQTTEGIQRGPGDEPKDVAEQNHELLWEECVPMTNCTLRLTLVDCQHLAGLAGVSIFEDRDHSRISPITVLRDPVTLSAYRAGTLNPEPHAMLWHVTFFHF